VHLRKIICTIKKFYPINLLTGSIYARDSGSLYF
jgi:hypothetical protein